MKYLFLILFCTQLSGQVEKIEEGYLFRNVEDVIELDYYAKKGKVCDSKIDENLFLIDQIRQAKLQSDSIALLLQKSNNELKRNFGGVENKLYNCNEALDKAYAEIARLEKEVKRQKRKRVWDWVKIGGGAIGLGFLFGAL